MSTPNLGEYVLFTLREFDAKSLNDGRTDNEKAAGLTFHRGDKVRALVWNNDPSGIIDISLERRVMGRYYEVRDVYPQQVAGEEAVWTPVA